MKSLLDSIRFELDYYFDKRTEEADIPDSARDSIYDRITDLVVEIESLIETAQNDIDETVRDFSPEEIQAIKDDIRTQDYLEASLFEEAV